ncbi:MAG: retropepsin-like aspartic protease [Dysgonamonadaceae bacterium]|nr:retropepsin-like aspartic protease [Dysgonamonadaceae bacterium]MDD4729431.1 retropepsin-like aspartic protease [Dysgonamonadaceae bacterium]
MKYKLFFVNLIIIISFTLSSCENQAGRREQQRKRPITSAQRSKPIKNDSKDKTTIKMIEKGGVYEIPCKINGTSMNFIFDTGASDITISLTEAMFLYKQGTLKDNDFLGTQKYQIANGAIEEGTVINLSTVKIGDRILHNVKASIIHNMEAPLLLGQSALREYGKISIDYTRNEITFE